MRVLVLGTGGVGSAFAAIARRRSFFEHCALADYDPARPDAVVAGLDDGRFSAHRVDASSKDDVVKLLSETRADAVVAGLGDGRFSAHRIDASSKDDVVRLIGETRADVVLNAVDPLFNVPIFDACFEAGVTYLDMAMTLSVPHPERPYEEVGVKLGDYQLERASQWKEAGLLALVGIGIEPGAADVFARHAADDLFSEIDEIGIRDGANLVVEGYDFAPTFSIWTTIEECLNPLTGLGKDGAPRKTYLNHVVDNEWSMREYGSQAVVWQTALNPVIALELLAAGEWKGTGVLGPEAFLAAPFLAKLEEYGAPHGVLELA